jgi:hypothetical protein
LAGATFTDSFRDSSFVFFCSDGVALFFGEGFGVVFGSDVFFGLGFGVGLAVGFTEALGTGLGVTVRFGEGVTTGVGAGVGVAAGNWISLGTEGGGDDSFWSSGADGETSGGCVASVAVSLRAGALIAATSPLIQTMLCKLACRVSRFHRTSATMTAT